MEENQNVNPEVKNSQEAGSIKNNQGKGISRKYFQVIWEFVKIIVIAAIIVLPIRYFLFQPFIVKGESMVPYLQSGDYLIIDEISYRFSEPKRGDVVVLNYPLDQKQRFIKRIIGLPGETVNIKNGEVTISKGQESFVLQESYLPESLETEGSVNMTLGNNEYFVLGDNRQFSYDSRRWGILPKEDIIGRAFFRVFPIATMTFIVGPSY